MSKFKVGDRVRVKSNEWYDSNKNKYGDVRCSNGVLFIFSMRDFLGCVVTIAEEITNGSYLVERCGYTFTDEMLEDETIKQNDEHEVLYGKHEDMITICNRHNTFFDVYHNGKVAYSLDRYNLLVLLTEMLLPEEKNMMKKFRPIKDQMDYVTKD